MRCWVNNAIVSNGGGWQITNHRTNEAKNGKGEDLWLCNPKMDVKLVNDHAELHIDHAEYRSIRLTARNSQCHDTVEKMYFGVLQLQMCVFLSPRLIFVVVKHLFTTLMAPCSWLPVISIAVHRTHTHVHKPPPPQECSHKCLCDSRTLQWITHPSLILRLSSINIYNLHSALLTSALVHAPWLSPDLKGIRLLLEGEGAIWGVLRGQARQWLVGGSGSGHRSLTGHCRGRVAGRVRVCAAMAAHAVLGAALAILPF